MEITINIPQDYSSVSLKKYLNMQNELKNYEDNEEAQIALMLHHLCDIPEEYVTKLSIDTYAMLKSELIKFINDTRLPLQRIILIDGVEYGFEPNLSQLAYGACLDITKYDTFQIDNNWAKIMSILYRPIKDKKGDMYTIKSYSGEINEEKFLNVGMDIHFGALFFVEFINGLVERYPEIFEGGGVASEHQVRFGKKWKGYASLVELTNGDLLKFSQITEQPLEMCLLYLAYKADKAMLDGILHREAMKRQQAL